MSNRNSKVSTANESAHASEGAGAPILLTARDLDQVAAAGGVSGGVVGSRSQPAAR